MRKLFVFFTVCFCLTGIASAQQKPRAKQSVTKPTVAAKPATTASENGTVTGRAYTNEKFNFAVTFPDTWLIPGDDFEDYMRKQGFDLGLKAPDSVGPLAKARMDQSLKRVTILVTAYRSMPGSQDNAIMRISTEDLRTMPQIKDAVDYFDLMRKNFQSMKLPADFKYSETQAEKLGQHQFAFLDATSSAGKKRMYATVRGGYAIMFTLSYSQDDDLQTMRQILAGGDFALK